VSSLIDVARDRTAVRGDALARLQRLVASWQPLADLCFADLLLLAPVDDDRRRFIVLGQVRPTTGQTLYPEDLVGMVVEDSERPLLAHAWSQGEILVGGGTVLGSADRERARVECIPVRHDGELIALLTREASTTSGRRHGELERHYLGVFDRLARMVAEGTFPFERDEGFYGDAPRVGDGAVVLDDELCIVFASPNAVSSLHRMGVHGYTNGVRLAEIGVDEHVVDSALRALVPVDEELERGDTTFTLRAVPLLEGRSPVGAILFLRDVTDLRRRDRMLLSKDATIREIHHRVKNNLQTIAALLRLQGRRLRSGEAQEAIEESERRIRSIAIVHETLSRDSRDVVPFDEIVRPLVRVVEETVSTPDLRVEIGVEGDAGEVRGDVATPLAVVLNELMQNAVDHAFAQGGKRDGHVRLRLERGDDELILDVVDDGIGLPAGFDLDESKGLGLSIVQALVEKELGGSIEMHDDGGTRVRLRVPLAPTAPVEL